ncbi:acyltransferase [Muricoccus pecuniae]|uniref:Acetyltransferase-like isoleucine patch superfamily enzyme n=1 Tax=Muricoccus pecuniae TaxID=693023 RepID=A0A840XYE9_9PROT|nr:acyltransferase [Roseomonas pecuniae]MBB5693505.1 acetyltransferase-like isoleucine patch superfamily enzyme [Roseomonas pecuniae]
MSAGGESREGLIRALTEHPAWGGFFDRPRPDHSFPDVTGARLFGTGAEDAAALAALGIQVDGAGPGNHILLAAERPGHKLRLRFGARTGCIVVIGAEGTISGTVGFEGDGHLFIFNGRGACQASATFRHHEGALFIGRNFTANLADFLVEGPRRSIVLGDDVMIAYRVQLRTSDSHGIVSLDDPASALNPPASIRVGPHVWIGKDAVVGRGVSIGRGAIVAMNTIVTKDVAPCTLVGGVPMRVLKERVTWTRASQPAPAEIEAAISFVGREGPV